MAWGGADRLVPYATDAQVYLEGVPQAQDVPLGDRVRHEDFIEPEPADPTARVRAGAAATEFFRRFRRHLGAGG